VLELEAEGKGLDLRLEGADQPEFLFTDEGEVVVRLEAEQEDILLRVTDTGTGISHDQLAARGRKVQLRQS